MFPFVWDRQMLLLNAANSRIRQGTFMLEVITGLETGASLQGNTVLKMDAPERQGAKCKMQETCRANFIYKSLFKQQALTEMLYISIIRIW